MFATVRCPGRHGTLVTEGWETVFQPLAACRLRLSLGPVSPETFNLV